MLSHFSLEKISRIFVGDVPIIIDDCEISYSYKKGIELVELFNNEFGFKDIYKAGFPSRYYYVKECMKIMQDSNKLQFFLIIY